MTTEEINADMFAFWNGKGGHTWVARQEHTDITLAPMTAVAQHLPPRPKPVANAPGMFAFADPEHVTEVLAAAGWTSPRFEKLDMDFDIAAGRGLEEAVIQSTEIGAVNSWLRNQPERIVSAAIASLREELKPYADGTSVRLPGAMWLVSSAPA